jgi:hypothetical protein
MRELKVNVTLEVKNGIVQDILVTDSLGNTLCFNLEIIDHDDREENIPISKLIRPEPTYWVGNQFWDN